VMWLRRAALDAGCGEQSWGDLKDAPVHLVGEYYASPVKKERTEVVCLTQVLQDEVNIGYSWDSLGLEVRAASVVTLVRVM
jgi:hypothetical protein